MATETLPSRQELDPQTTWNLGSLFPTEDAYLQEFEATAEAVAGLTRWRGRLGRSGSELHDFMESYWNTEARLLRLRLYAQLPVAADGTDQQARARAGRFASLVSKWSEGTSFVEPELLELGRARLAELTRMEPRLELYSRYFARLEAQRAHVRSSEVEELLGGLSEPFAGASRTYGSLVNSDLRYEPVRLPDGELAELAPSTLPRLRKHADRGVRRQAVGNYADAFLAYRNTFTDLYLTRVRQSAFLARNRGYPSTVEEALTPKEVPREALEAVLRVFRANLSVWHRYWAVRRRLLGVERLELWDVFAPLSQEPLEIPYERAVEWILEGLEPLGPQYLERLRRGLLQERWVDIYPNRGKRDGAFAARAPGAQPFILMSYDEGTGGMSTLAHELGHAMHSQLTQEAQPVVYSDYSMVVAETASNLNQTLLFAHLLETRDEPELQLAVLEEALYNLHRYFFIMPTLARFELAAHEAVERGEGLTADRLLGIMRDLFAEGYGDEMQVDDRVGITWAQFGHLYVPFYTFQYAVGISAAAVLATDLRAGRPGAVERVLGFLRGGNRLTPMETLREAGVDMTTDEPFERAFEVLEGYVARLEELADGR